MDTARGPAVEERQVSVAYAIDPNQSSRAFVRVKERGSLYIRTHVCVVFVKCPWCHAAAGEPCVSVAGMPKAETHCSRRDAYAAKVKKERKRGT